MDKIIVNIDWAFDDEGSNYCAGSENPIAMGCIATANTIEEMKLVYTDALKFHLEGEEKEGNKYKLEFVLTDRAKRNKR